MYESILLESGKVFIGNRVSGIGAKVVDDSRTIAIPVFIPEGNAYITSFAVPIKFTPNIAFAISINVKNEGYSDDLFIKITNTDTSEVLIDVSKHVVGGENWSWADYMTVIQTTDFHGIIEVGHVE